MHWRSLGKVHRRSLGKVHQLGKVHRRSLGKVHLGKVHQALPPHASSFATPCIKLCDPMPLLVCDKQTTGMLAQGKLVVVGETETVGSWRDRDGCALVHLATRDAMQTLSWACNCAYKW